MQNNFLLYSNQHTMPFLWSLFEDGIRKMVPFFFAMHCWRRSLKFRLLFGTSQKGNAVISSRIRIFNSYKLCGWLLKLSPLNIPTEKNCKCLNQVSVKATLYGHIRLRKPSENSRLVIGVMSSADQSTFTLKTRQEALNAAYHSSERWQNCFFQKRSHSKATMLT